MLYVLFKVTNDLCCGCLDCCCLIDLLTAPSTLTLELGIVCLLVFYLLVCFGGCFPRSLWAVLTLVRVSLLRTYINMLKYSTNLNKSLLWLPQSDAGSKQILIQTSCDKEEGIHTIISQWDKHNIQVKRPHAPNVTSGMLTGTQNTSLQRGYLFIWSRVVSKWQFKTLLIAFKGP